MPTLLHAEQRTLLVTLYLHARDAASARPILGDVFAADLLGRVVPDPTRLRWLDADAPMICTRAALIDDVTRTFLDRHPDAVVLHLGGGLDSRVLRVAPHPAVSWVEVDQEPVIELRRRLYPPREGVTTVAASVTDPAWWARIPDGRPQLVVAEGLLMYLTPEDVRTTIAAALDRRAARHTLVADTVAPWVTRIARWHPVLRATGAAFRSSTAALSAAVGSRSDVLLRAETSVTEATARRTGGATSRFLALVDALPAMHRAMVVSTYVGNGADRRDGAGPEGS